MESNAVTQAIVKRLGTYSSNFDAFGRQRVSQPFTIFDSKQIFDNPDLANSVENSPLFYDNQETSGSGTSTLYNHNHAKTVLSVGAETEGTRVRQTRQRFNYQPGKSQLFLLTFNFNSNEYLGITKRRGAFDENNGVFLQHKDGVTSFVIRSDSTGSPVDNVIPQSEWNINRLDTVSTSADIYPVLDLTKTQILFMSYEWLGVGSVFFGFFIDGIPYLCHIEHNANVNDKVYMSTPNLPIRTEISNDGTAPADSIDDICATVISEGGVEPSGASRSVDNGITEVNANVVGTIYAAIIIRLKAGYLGATIFPDSVGAILQSNNLARWSLHFNPTLSGTPSYTGLANSAIEYAVATGDPASITLSAEGTKIKSSYLNQSSGVIEVDLKNNLRLGSLIDGTPDILVLGITPLTTNLNAYCSLSWREL